MVRCETWLLRGLLSLMWVFPVWMNVTKEECNAIQTIKDQLNSSLRRRYLKHNFPINYTIQVPYEEIFRLQNISKLRNDTSVKMEHLQDVWLRVAKEGIKKILRVLPERHPTRQKYLNQLENLFRIYEQKYGTKITQADADDVPEIIEHIVESIGKQNLGMEGWRSIKPKSLLDNCYRAMHCLFQECFPREGDEYDYCNIHHWRKWKGTTPQPT